jgi:hypothetical protein
LTGRHPDRDALKRICGAGASAGTACLVPWVLPEVGLLDQITPANGGSDQVFTDVGTARPA